MLIRLVGRVGEPLKIFLGTRERSLNHVEINGRHRTAQKIVARSLGSNR
jgi:hypothetical protein